MTDYFEARDNQHLRVKIPQTPRSARFFIPWDDDIPTISSSDDFAEVVAKLVDYLHKAVDAAYSYEQLKTTLAGQSLRSLVVRLSEDCHHPALVAALLTAKYVFRASDDEGTGLSECKGLACELVAWQFLTCLSETEIMDYLLYEVPDVSAQKPIEPLSTMGKSPRVQPADSPSEQTPLVERRLQSTACEDGGGTSRSPTQPVLAPTGIHFEDTVTNQAATGTVDDTAFRSLVGMNALEIAGILSAKRFISQRTVQKIVDDIWYGDVIFWETLNVEAVRRPRRYNKQVADPFTRLRVPRYQKAFQVGFFVSFLVLFYAVLLSPDSQQITLAEVLLYFFIAAFAYDELGDIQDTGILFYRVDFWALWDVAIIGVSMIFMALRIYGKVKHDDDIMRTAFDCLSLVALFLVPRIFSVVSLNPTFGSLIPVLKEMLKSFCLMVPVILVLWAGFLTSFSMLARSQMTVKEVSDALVKVFYGAAQFGFDTSVKISPSLGYFLMLIYVPLTNVVLISSLVALVSNSLTEIMNRAREEYLFQYSIYVLESNSSRRLTYFMPPLNLIPLLFLRPLRLVLPSDRVRHIRILLLKATHVGFIALIWLYEATTRLVRRGGSSEWSGAAHSTQSRAGLLDAGFRMDQDVNARRPWPSSALTKATPTKAPSEVSGVAESELVKLIQKLSSQVDELTAMVVEQQRKPVA